MVLPSWLRTSSQPLAIDDVVAALAGAAQLADLRSSACYDLPGPNILTGRQILVETAHALGHRRVITIEVPVLSPSLSSHWVRLVTRADWSVARELVLGLTHDLLARNADYWKLIGHPALLTFEAAARRAIDEERRAGHMALSGRVLEVVAGGLAGGRPGGSVDGRPKVYQSVSCAEVRSVQCLELPDVLGAFEVWGSAHNLEFLAQIFRRRGTECLAARRSSVARWPANADDRRSDTPYCDGSCLSRVNGRSTSDQRHG